MDTDMNIVIKKIGLPLTTMIIVSLLLGGCNKALIYAEGTNVSLATLRVNDAVTEPVSVNFGLDRTVAAVVPPKTANGEAVNMISGFMLDNDGNTFGTLTIKTQFASGQAGLDLATKNPKAAAHIMNITSVVPDGPELRKQKENAIAFVEISTNDAGIDKVAVRMGVKDYRNTDKQAIRDAINNAEANLFKEYTNIIKSELGSPF